MDDGGKRILLLGVRQIKLFTDATFTLENLGTLVFRVRIDRIVDDQVQDAGNGGQLIITDGQDILYPEEPLLTGTEILNEMNHDKPYSIDSYEQGSILQDESSYLEVSGSAGIATAILMRGRLYNKYTQKAIEGILARIKEDGTVMEVSAGTAVMNDIQGYRDVPCNRIQGWGQGLTLAFLAELLRTKANVYG